MSIDFRERFERDLKVNDLVQARWTRDYKHFVGKARITKVNRKSVKVELMEAVEYDAANRFSEGKIVIVPLLGGSGFGPGNCIQPIKE